MKSYCGVQIMNNKKYKIKDCTVEKLLALGFRKTFSTGEDCEEYKYRFPVHKHNNRMVLECELTIDSKTGDVLINVYDNNKNIFIAFYNREFGDYSVILNKIQKNILTEFKKLDIEEVK